MPLGLSPLCVWRDDHLKGLTRLVTLALRLLTLLEMQVRRGLAQAQTSLAGLYEGALTRTTARPSGLRILQAFARPQLTSSGLLTRLSCLARGHPSSCLPKEEPAEVFRFGKHTRQGGETGVKRTRIRLRPSEAFEHFGRDEFEHERRGPRR